MTINQQAWALLSQDEKTALSLQLGMTKSSWESGEIMNKSHYKYLEIKYRGVQFLKMFTEHLEVFDEIVPNYVKGDGLVIKYLKLCLEKRMKPIPAMVVLSQEFGRVSKAILNEKITNQFKKWETEDNAIHQTVMNLVKEFDRWNNFRILPKNIQEPSAFKRRVKNAYKKQIKATCSLHELAIEKIQKLYGTKKSPSMYLPLISNSKPIILRIKINNGSMNVVNTISLYTFKSQEDATNYTNAIFEYLGKGKKDCIDGLTFWPKYRDIIQRAVNYQKIMQINPSRKYLQLAMEKLNFV